jgi:Ni,Fe-hydrogenase maturation factor
LRSSGIFSHEFSPATLLSLAQELYGSAPQGVFITLCGACFDHGEGLSPEVQSRLPAVVEMVIKQIDKFVPVSKEERNSAHG